MKDCPCMGCKMLTETHRVTAAEPVSEFLDDVRDTEAFWTRANDHLVAFAVMLAFLFVVVLLAWEKGVFG